MKQVKNVFIGNCDLCGETYEAQTTLEDLEGVSFICKKMLCEGKVELKFSGMENRAMKAMKDVDKNPRRYC